VRLEELAATPGFTGWSHTDKVRAFAWWAIAHGGRPFFTTGDVNACFGRLGMLAPKNTTQLITNLADAKPPQVIKSGGGWILEHRIRTGLDEKLGGRPATAYVSKLLAELPARLPEQVEQVFLEEAIRCFRGKAFRAAIVMTWNLTFDHLCHYILAKHLPAFNGQLRKQFDKAFERGKLRDVTIRADFTELQEADILVVCRASMILHGNVYKILETSLQTRNIAAHPSTEVFRDTTAEEYIRNLVENVVLVLT
jgi:hypothetical protein